MEIGQSNDKGDGLDILSMVLKLPWTSPLMATEPCTPWKAKCIAVQASSKLGRILRTESDFEVLDLALHDESEEVRTEAVISLPVIVLWSGHDALTHMFKRLE